MKRNGRKRPPITNPINPAAVGAPPEPKQATVEPVADAALFTIGTERISMRLDDILRVIDNLNRVDGSRVVTVHDKAGGAIGNIILSEDDLAQLRAAHARGHWDPNFEHGEDEDVFAVEPIAR